jgi:hypothetical protein
MQTVPEWLQIAFVGWITGRLYVDGRGNYRSRAPGRPIVLYNRALKRLYPQNDDFYQAAHRWLSLWEVVPTARLTGPRRGRTPRSAAS